MEIAPLRRLIKPWRDNFRVITCVHDCDAKASQVIGDPGWEIAEYYDLNQIAKAFDRKWQRRQLDNCEECKPNSGNDFYPSCIALIPPTSGKNTG
jgi:hypothetical protein